MAPFPESAVVTLPVPAKQLLDLQESTAFRTLLAQARLQRHLLVHFAVQKAGQNLRGVAESRHAASQELPDSVLTPAT